MKKLILTGMILFAGISSFSQSRDIGFDIHSRTIDINQKSLAFGLTEAEFEAIKNDAYANADFIPGTIYQDNKPIKTGVPMRYNAYADEVEMKASNGAESALIKDPNIYVKMGDQFYVLVPFEGSNEKGGYFNVMHEGERFSLYKKVKAVFREAKVAESTYARDTPPSFAKTTTYYLIDNGTFYQLPNRKAQIQKVFDKSQKEMKDFIKDNKLDLSKESDLIRATEYYDSLHSK